MQTLVAVAPEPKPINHEDFLAFLDLILPQMSDQDFFDVYWRRKQNAASYRRGEFFVTCLPPEYRKMVTGSSVDPWYKDDWESCYAAIEWLLERI